MEVYLDNSSTTIKKPKEVFNSLSYYYHNNNANAGRGNYKLALENSKMIYYTRNIIGNFFNINKKKDIVIFTKNITEALNIVINGIIKKGDHVIITSIEHNSVFRKVHSLYEQKKIKYDIVKLDKTGSFNINFLKKKIKYNTKCFIFNHVSNVSGHILPINEIVKFCKEKKIITIIDGAQSAGFLPYDHSKIGADVYCFTGHKYLMGPIGIGGFIISEKLGAKIEPLIYGGTGSISEKNKMPEFLPDRFEAGTLNILGIAGLKGSIEYLSKQNLKKIYMKKNILSNNLIEALKKIIPEIKFYGDLKLPRISLFSFNIKYVDNSKLAYILEKDFNIISRSGLHCSPLAHKTFNNLTGSLRFSLGYYTKEKEIDYIINSFKILSKNNFKILK